MCFVGHLVLDNFGYNDMIHVDGQLRCLTFTISTSLTSLALLSFQVEGLRLPVHRVFVNLCLGFD